MPRKNVIKKSALSPTVLIAGGAGFIGSHLAETLLLKGSRVIVLDNFKTGKQTYVNHLLSESRFALFDVDINQGLPSEIESVDYIFHIAGVEEYSSEVNLDSLLTNAVGTRNLLELAQKSGAKFVLASSINVYQGMMSQQSLEQYFGRTGVEEGKYSLAEAKRYAEALVWEYFKKNSTDVRIVRLPEIYGPKMDLGTCGELGRLLDELIHAGDLTIYGDGSDKDFYLFINDAVSGLIKSVFTPNTQGKVFSLVSGEPYSALEIAFLLKSVASREIKIGFKSKENEIRPKRSVPDTFNLRDIEWEAKLSFKDGIVNTLSWFGYEPNQHSFKPAKIIEEKQKEKKVVPDSLSTLAGLGSFGGEPANETGAAAIAGQTQTLSSGESPFLPRKKPSRKIFLPHINRPHLSLGRSAKTVVSVILSLIFLITVFLAMPAAQFYFNFKSGVSELYKAPLMVGQFDSNGAVKSSNDAFQHLYKSQRAFNSLGWIFKLSGNKDLFNSAGAAVSSLGYVSKSSYYFSKAFTPFSFMWEVVRPDSQAVFDVQGLEQSKVDFASAQNNLQLAEAAFKNVDIDLFPTDAQNPLKEYEKILSSATSNMDMISAALMGFSDIIGVEQNKKYLILFQNSNEIRPTGGFIGSYALLEVEKGKIKNLSIDDIYNPDGQIDVRGIKEPAPAPIHDFLNEDRLHIRNANWDPDFTQSARVIEGLYSQVTGEKVDGVIAVDLYFAKSLLEVTGPIYLTAYNEEISSANLYERAQYHSEFNYTDGSDQKRSFLTLLGSKLLEKVFALPKDQLPQLWGATYKSLNEKHLSIYINNNPFAAYLEKQGWDGSLVKTEGDYLYVVNANVGGTKANYFVKNEMAYEVKSLTRDGLLRGFLTLKYTHTGESDSWPGGPYKDYVRVITQQGSKLTGATIKHNDGTEEDLFKEIIIDKAGNYNSFETNFEIKPKETVEIKINYDIPEHLSVINGQNLDYSLYWQKQPGTQEDKAAFVFEPPFGLKSNFTPFDGLMNTDKSFTIRMEPI